MGYTESGGPFIVACHSRRFDSALGNADIPGALAICQYELYLEKVRGRTISCINSDCSLLELVRTLNIVGFNGDKGRRETEHYLFVTECPSGIAVADGRNLLEETVVTGALVRLVGSMIEVF